MKHEHFFETAAKKCRRLRQKIFTCSERNTFRVNLARISDETFSHCFQYWLGDEIRMGTSVDMSYFPDPSPAHTHSPGLRVNIVGRVPSLHLLTPLNISTIF